jgi:hypothetical protein
LSRSLRLSTVNNPAANHGIRNGAGTLPLPKKEAHLGKLQVKNYAKQKFPA